MTMQVRDTIELKFLGYELAYVDGDLDFKPQDYGIVPMPPNTGCWRGYYCHYSISRKGVFLEQLNVCDMNGNYPPINGVQAVPCNDGTRTYKNLGLQMDFTGSVCGGKKLVKEFLERTGLYSYKIEKEFIYKNGQLVETRDRSAEAAKERGEFLSKNADK